jgi:hypothetical protein
VPTQGGVVVGWHGLNELAQGEVRELVEVSDAVSLTEACENLWVFGNDPREYLKALPAMWNPARAAVRMPNADATDGAPRRRSEPSQTSSCTSDDSCRISITQARSTASRSGTVAAEGSSCAQANASRLRSRLPGTARMWR